MIYNGIFAKLGKNVFPSNFYSIFSLLFYFALSVLFRNFAT